MPADRRSPESSAPDGGLPVRAGSDWLALREPADALARSRGLVEELRRLLPPGPLEVHDLGSGTGSMVRWLAPLLDGAQQWVLHDRDQDLLREAAAMSPPAGGDGSEVSVTTRGGDVTRLDLTGAGLVTASALLDMLTLDELSRLVESSARAGCPVLITLSVVGRVELSPADPRDEQVATAFNDHQRRMLVDQPLLGPDAVAAAVELLARHGLEVLTRPSPWHLGPDDRALVRQWLAGWLDAAYEQQPTLSTDYARRRRADATAGRLAVTVHHEDLLAWHPRT